MKRILLFIFPLFLAGCCFNSSTPQTEYFNISTPESSASYNYDVKLGAFTVDSLYDTKMVFTKENYSIYFDNFNRWAQAPNRMLAAYLYLYFNNPHSHKIEDQTFDVKLNADILKFDCNLTSHKAVLFVKISAINISDNSIVFSDIFTDEQSVKDLTAFSYAVSMADAFQSVAIKVEEQLNNIYKINNDQATKKGMK